MDLTEISLYCAHAVIGFEPQCHFA